jgi:hypothetical protein
LKPATITPNQRRHAQEARAPHRPQEDVGKRMPPAVEYIEPAAPAPGLGDLRQRLEGAQPGWLEVAMVLPLILGGAAFASLRKGVQHAERLDRCDPSPHPQGAP